ncbi:MAG: beta-glucosidase [Candidatus Thermofonsia Clade 1 bacterium]|jgi:beta-glucosidase|uniref:Beta-glucosidase n=1 Tax=Candidatus Thermofonsia Clade 1 bacterium TaxID=2364210 RepID=A0A2M8PCA5_9CHLR|nr:MAG: beta-glucosidase [Candidatus Thermofonsia Clade 1 bacterium]RMF51462.1 MAG: beta-glucosidase [Chloroflexota bacterium]
MTLSPRYLDPYQTVEVRVNALLAEMSMPEKVAQLQSVWVNALIDAERRFAPERAAAPLQHGIGQIARVGGASILPPVQSAELANAIQGYLKYHTRLGIPALVHEESCAGYLARGATTFPQPIGLAATWQPELIEAMARLIRQQMRAVGAHHALAPVLDVARDARWGRIEETFGEDPYLISQMGIAYVRGLQGDDLREGIAATLKHFLGYSASEGGMNWAPAHIGARELREVYAMPFKAAIHVARAASVMNAYSEIDGLPLGSSRELLYDLLRRELGFSGVVASDYFTLKTFVDYHQIAADKTEAARFGLEAGIDLELPAADCYGEPLLQGLATGKIDPQLVEESVKRVLTLKFQLGVFENPFVETGRIPEIYSDKQGATLSRQIAEKTLVLLKNEGDLLPLSPSLESIAVIGPHADSLRLLQGDYHFPSHYEGLFDPSVSLDAPTPSENAIHLDWSALLPPSISVLEGIRSVVSPTTQVLYAKGCEVIGDDRSGFEAAIAAVERAQVAVVVVGDKSGLSKPAGATSGESIDSATLELPGLQGELIKAVQATGTPTVVVLLIGRPYAITWLAEHVPAILVAWLPAEQGGAAIANALFGKVNPSGRLPITFPRHVGQVPIFYAHKPSGGRSNWWGDYVDLCAKPLYAFGHGLSYTHFAYSDLSIDSAQVRPDQSVNIAFTLKNIGERAGDEVVQLYVSDPIASVTRPVKLLKGFKRVTLQPNESKRITFRLDARHLAFYDRAMRYVVEPGKIIVSIGASSEDIRLVGEFEIVGESTVVEQVYTTPVQVS